MVKLLNRMAQTRRNFELFDKKKKKKKKTLPPKKRQVLTCLINDAILEDVSAAETIV